MLFLALSRAVDSLSYVPHATLGHLIAIPGILLSSQYNPAPSPWRQEKIQIILLAFRGSPGLGHTKLPNLISLLLGSFRLTGPHPETLT